MAEIVAGIASSHTPQLSTGTDLWSDHAARDRNNKKLLGHDAEFHTYEELLATADPGLADEITAEVWAAKHDRCQKALRLLGDRLAAAKADIVVIYGDDQNELFTDDGVPTFSCFTGSELIDRPLPGEAFAKLPKGIQAASWAAHGSEPTAHQVSAELSRRVLDFLVENDFDMTRFGRQPEGRSLGHAFTFPRYRLGLSPDVPIVPIFINTYYPPNVPTAGRCYALGSVVRQAIESWDSEARVAIVASGGLSHFVVDEDLDWRVLNAIERNDAVALTAFSRRRLRSGTSEILNWIAAAGTLGGLRASIIDYVPGYRTPAGTGAGMAFVSWARE
ncbi:DODA-type extradiol aromatic ring-opening family dioxygenase [Amycolatopsis pigmentata]|uniref:Extradiol ring-cleavage dioxygenase class III enzyme subunit B domain-containing protein n=1 Tax=Amycolatopsis pigmentata TaxID=450801 RepID=A0ABW5FNF5_9PSEU